MKVYVTKYALSEGIKEVEVLDRDAGSYIRVEWVGGYNGRASFVKGDYADTAEEAAAQARKLRDKKIASFKTRITKLEAMTF